MPQLTIVKVWAIAKGSAKAFFRPPITWSQNWEKGIIYHNSPTTYLQTSKSSNSSHMLTVANPARTSFSKHMILRHLICRNWSIFLIIPGTHKPAKERNKLSLIFLAGKASFFPKGSPGAFSNSTL